MFNKLNWLKKKELLEIIGNKKLEKYFEKEVDLKNKKRAEKAKEKREVKNDLSQM